MKKFKRLFLNGYRALKVVSFFAIMAVCFYTGMYVVSSQQSPGDAGNIMISKIDQALSNTEYQPIIMIVPEHSLIEKAKLRLGVELPEREIVTITTIEATQTLGITLPKKPGYFTVAKDGTIAAFNANCDYWSAQADSKWNWIVNKWEEMTTN